MSERYFLDEEKKEEIEIIERNIGELNVFTEGYFPWSYIRNWPGNIVTFFRNIKYAYQRATKGYCDRDCWGLDWYYLRLFYHTLKHLAKTTMSWNADEELTSYEDWVKYLSDMADHFENAQEENENIPINQELDELRTFMATYIIKLDSKPCEEHSDFYILDTKYSDEEAYKKVREEERAKSDEAALYREQEKNLGLEMMSKHFFGLWD